MKDHPIRSFFAIIGSLLILAQLATAAPRPGSPLRAWARVGNATVELGAFPPAGAVGGVERVFRPISDTVKAELLTKHISDNEIRYEVLTVPRQAHILLGAAVAAATPESFVGLFERLVDGSQYYSWKPGTTATLDLRGETARMDVKPSLGLYSPFYLSTRDYGLFVEGTWPGTFDMAKTHPGEVQFVFEGGQLAFHVIRDEQPLSILRRYSELTAKPLLPPRWVLRPWRWRDDHDRFEKFWDGTMASGPYNPDIIEDILMMEALDIPCGVYWIDRPWASGKEGYGDLDISQFRLPNMPTCIDWLARKDIKVGFWIAPWVLGDMYDVGHRRGYFIPTKYDEEKKGLVDFSNPDAVAWWQTYLKKLTDIGVAGFKLDRSEEIVPDVTDTIAHNGKTMREFRNDYPRWYAKATYDHMRSVYGDDFFVMPRAGYAGSQAYAIFWGGDTYGSQWGLRSAIISLQRCAVLGFGFWGSDTGGYVGGFNRESTARWLAFSAFCPLMEVGPTKNTGLWDVPWDPGYDAELLAMWSLYGKVHDRLGDYLYDWARHAHETGEPIVRPMFVQYPDDPQCSNLWDEYMFGPDVLVCPLWRSDVRQRSVYLPEGKWRNIWNPKEIIQGPTRRVVDCPLHVIPVYTRADSDLDLGDLQQTYDKALRRAERKPDMYELLQKAKFYPREW